MGLRLQALFIVFILQIRTCERTGPTRTSRTGLLRKAAHARDTVTGQYFAA